jgi:hypothetical protein
MLQTFSTLSLPHFPQTQLQPSMEKQKLAKIFFSSRKPPQVSAETIRGKRVEEELKKVFIMITISFAFEPCGFN